MKLLLKKLISQKIKFIWTFVGKNTHKIKENDFIKRNVGLFNFIDDIQNTDETYYPHSDLIKIYLDNDLYMNLARIIFLG